MANPILVTGAAGRFGGVGRTVTGCWWMAGNWEVVSPGIGPDKRPCVYKSRMILLCSAIRSLDHFPNENDTLTRVAIEGFTLRPNWRDRARLRRLKHHSTD